MSTTYDYELLLNVEFEQDDADRTRRAFSGYQPGDRMAIVWAGKVTAEDLTAAAEQVFRRFNIDHPDGYRQRSMSVGDVVVLETPDGEVAMACEPAGWRQCPAPDPDRVVANRCPMFLALTEL